MRCQINSPNKYIQHSWSLLIFCNNITRIVLVSEPILFFCSPLLCWFFFYCQCEMKSEKNVLGSQWALIVQYKSSSFFSSFEEKCRFKARTCKTTETVLLFFTTKTYLHWKTEAKKRKNTQKFPSGIYHDTYEILED